MTRELQIVLETMKQGPRARMPVHWAAEPIPPTVAAASEQPKSTSNENKVQVEEKTENTTVAAMPTTQAVARVNQNGTGTENAMALHAIQALNSMANSAATTSPEMLVYLRSLNQNPAAVANTQASGFEAGFRAATQYHNIPLNSMFLARGGPVPLVPGSNGIASQIGAQVNPQVNTEYMRLLQLQMAADGGLGGMSHGATSNAGQGHNGNMTLDQLQAYQAGLWHPSMSRQGGRF